MSMIDKFLEHPRAREETYFEYQKNALRSGFLLGIASIACIIHSFIPFIFKKTATNIARDIVAQRCKED